MTLANLDPSCKPTLRLKFPPAPEKLKPKPAVVAEAPKAAAAIKAPTKKERARNNALRTRYWLRRQFPKCFMPFGEPKKPLKIGIFDDILAIYGGSYKGFRYLLEGALRDYVHGETYLRAMVAGAIRVDLEGNVAGNVTEKAATLAAERLANLLNPEKAAA